MNGRHPLRQTTGVTSVAGAQSRPGPRPSPAPRPRLTILLLDGDCSDRQLFSSGPQWRGGGCGRSWGRAFPDSAPAPSETKRGGWARGTGGGCGAQSGSEGPWLLGATESRTHAVAIVIYGCPGSSPILTSEAGGRGTQRERSACLSAEKPYSQLLQTVWLGPWDHPPPPG